MTTSSIQFKTHINRLPHLVGMHYIEVPKKIIQKLGGKLNVRLICTVNKALTFQCGPVALGNGEAYISLNAKRMKQLGVKNRDEILVSLIKDTSKYGIDMSEELAELLKQDDEGKKRFNNLPPAKQRYIIYYVSLVKSSRLRIERAILLITNLKMLKPGKESFREILGLGKRV